MKPPLSVLVFDGYLDEPAALGVPPYISPMVRAMAGAASDASAEAEYFSIDQWRDGEMVPDADMLAMIGGNSVPGRYLRSMPASLKEMEAVISSSRSFTILGGSAADSRLSDLVDVAAGGDVAAAVHDVITEGEHRGRRRDLNEWNRWMLLGAPIVKRHKDHPQPLIAEVETYRGCHRHWTGGCSFCVEPLKGEPLFREPEDIIAEAEALKENGVRNIRLGGQTCIVSYKSEESGVPRPNVAELERLFQGLRSLELDVLHVDNGNPAVIASYPEESRQALEIISECCTPGNVIALGVESADPAVIGRNNLNASPSQSLEAIRMINETGGERGGNGMPKLLPGINLIIGLEGESADTYRLNHDFLEKVREEGLLLRRINIRQVIASRKDFNAKVDRKRFLRFKEDVRNGIDMEMLRSMLPFGTVLRDVYTEMHQGALTFARQIGSYPILVSIPYHAPLDEFKDLAVVDWGFRSVTAVEYPFPINEVSLTALSSLPGIGRKRAAALFRARPVRDAEHLRGIIGDEAVAERLLPLIYGQLGERK